ncbi:MAG: OsmC family protein [Gemmatimonadota bacterium]|nr:OsmC family protein [Gemmatimonadota bacterium]
MRNTSASNIRQATMTWVRDMVFEGGAPGGPVGTLDGDGAAGPSPVTGLLMAVAGCTGSDVVSILAKMRVSLTRLTIEVIGTRRDDHPRRFVNLHLVFDLAGDGLDETKARRAIELSLDKYCSVIHSLAPDITVTHELRLG